MPGGSIIGLANTTVLASPIGPCFGAAIARTRRVFGPIFRL